MAKESTGDGQLKLTPNTKGEFENDTPSWHCLYGKMISQWIWGYLGVVYFQSLVVQGHCSFHGTVHMAMAHPDLQHRCEGYRDLLRKVHGAQELRILAFLLEELAGVFREHSPALQPPPVYEGVNDHEYYLRGNLSWLMSNLCPEEGYDQHRVQQLFESCCCAFKLVKEAIYQAGASGVSRRGSHKMSRDVTIFRV